MIWTGAQCSTFFLRQAIDKSLMTANDKNIKGQAYLALSTAHFLHLGPDDILGQIFIVEELSSAFTVGGSAASLAPTH